MCQTEEKKVATPEKLAEKVLNIPIIHVFILSYTSDRCSAVERYINQELDEQISIPTVFSFHSVKGTTEGDIIIFTIHTATDDQIKTIVEIITSLKNKISGVFRIPRATIFINYSQPNKVVFKNN